MSDEPTASDDDPLDFDRVATELARTILRSRGSTPFTLGIEGGWGSGKSSLMRQIECKLRMLADGDAGGATAVTTVWFNAWAAEGASALEGLIKTVLQQLDPNIIRRALRRRGLVRGARVLGLLVADLLRLGRLADVVWQRTSVDAQARNELRGLMREAMQRWLEKQQRLGRDRLLVVFVDDLDRASPTQVLEIFEAMKLYLDAPGFVFVVGYDQAVISEAVLEEKKYSRSVTGREYLEKIMQVGYRIPPPDDDQAGRLLTEYMRGSGTADLFTEAARTVVIDRNQRNPRRIKRFINTFVLLYGLEPEWQELGPERLVDVLLLDMHFPDFVALFRAGPDADPADELLTYREDRRKALELPRPDRGERLEELQENLPEQFPQWVVNTEFVALVESLRATPQWEQVRLKLQRRRPLPLSFPEDARPESPAAGSPAEIRWPDRSLLVLTGRPSPLHERIKLDPLLLAGWRAWYASNADEAVGVLLASHIDALVVDLDQSEDPDRGFDDLTTLRDIYSGSVIMFTSRITPERRRRADALNVHVASDAESLVHLLEGRATPERRSEP